MSASRSAAAISALKRRALSALDALAPEARDLALRIHANPEIGFQEHQAAPWNGVNALDAVILTFNGVGALRQQIRPDARIHGIVTDGGQAVNIIPQRAAMALGVRSSDGGYVQELIGRVEACARGAAAATGTTLEVSRHHFLDGIKFNPTLAEIVRENVKALGFQMDARFVGASTDLGNLRRVVPTLSYGLPTCPPGVGMHTREALEAGAAEIGLTGMMNDARVMVMTAIDLLAAPELVERVRHDFEAGNFSGASPA